jgi:hypothetical protein
MQETNKPTDSVTLFVEELENLYTYDLRAGGYNKILPERIVNMYSECFKKETSDADRIEYLRHITSMARHCYGDYSEGNLFMCEISNLQIETYRKKNADYGDSFKKSMDEDGILVAKIRIGDKIRRIESLLKKGGEGQVKDEKLQDTFLDLANYCVMTILWLKGQNQ